MKTCGFAGCRVLTQNQVIKAAQDLSWIINFFIDSGYTHFICSVANDIDLLAIQIILKFQKTNKSLFLEAAVSHGNRRNLHDEHFQYILNSCDKTTIVLEQHAKEGISNRNKYMVDNSDLVVAVWDGQRSGGTYNTIIYAKSQSKEIITIGI